MFPIKPVASEDGRADAQFFERRKAAYLAFVDKQMGDLGANRVDAVFQKKKSCRPGFCRNTSAATQLIQPSNGESHSRLAPCSSTCAILL